MEVGEEGGSGRHGGSRRSPFLPSTPFTFSG